jgi:hypothetical protein
MKAATVGRAGRRRERLKDLYLSLPKCVYEALRHEASQMRKPATVLAREAIEARLQERKRAVVREAIASYAVRHAGSSVDLDPALERAALEAWRAKKPRR